MAKVRVRCPNENCGTPYAVDEALLGEKRICKRCQTAYVLTRDVWGMGEVILGEFEVRGKLGQGGMGAVFLVRSRHSGQQFAVKKTLQRDADSRRNFQAELRTWIDLPPHPHLVACRFFRTIGDETAIFSELVAGGSLATWIRERRLTRLEQLLDVAIQFAWGLHAAHELGLVHQDVKPGNVLMTKGGVAKVSDFGLARARALGVKATSAAGQSGAVQGAGLMTAEYCSPEQAAGQALTRKTDIWSWGVSVLEMFIGETTWGTGLAASDVLTAYGTSGPAVPELPRMPAGVVKVLERCFVSEPAGRWPSLARAADALEQTYRQAVGRTYPRLPEVIAAEQPAAAAHDRRTVGGVEWGDARAWLIEAFKAEGTDPAQVDKLLPARQGSRTAQALADLAAYEEARLIFERLVADGRKDLEFHLAGLCFHKAFIHESTDDRPGAVESYDRAIAIFERLVEQEGRRDLAGVLAEASMNKANVVGDLGDKRAAVELYDRTIALLKRLVEQEGRRELADTLATAYMNKANALGRLGDNRAAVELYDRAIALWKRLVEQEGRRELAGTLATAYMNKATSLQNLGDNRAAVELFDRAIVIWKRLVEQEGRRELADDLARACMNKAISLSLLADNRAAVELFDRAIVIWKRLVEQEGQRELAGDLANAYMNKASAVSNSGDKRAAVELYDRAIALWKRLVEQEGRRELANLLAMAYMNKADAVGDLGDKRAAVELFDRAIAIYKRLVEQEGRRELAGELAKTYMNKANAVGDLGDKRAAVELYDRAIAIRARLVEQEGRRELADDLAMAYLRKGDKVADHRAAVEVYDRAIAILKRLVEQEERQELAYKLAVAYTNKAGAVGALGDKRAAVKSYDLAIAIWKRLVEQEGQQEFANVLAMASEGRRKCRS